jgi:hypothetical protein
MGSRTYLYRKKQTFLVNTGQFDKSTILKEESIKRAGKNSDQTWCRYQELLQICDSLVDPSEVPYFAAQRYVLVLYKVDFQRWIPETLRCLSMPL